MAFRKWSPEELAYLQRYLSKPLFSEERKELLEEFIKKFPTRTRSQFSVQAAIYKSKMTDSKVAVIKGETGKSKPSISFSNIMIEAINSGRLSELVIKGDDAHLTFK